MSQSISLNTPVGNPADWILDRSIDFLNHGSFGACPRPVLEAQRQYQEELEREPVQFMVRRRPQLLDRARDVLARFLGAPADDLVFVPNATTGVNAVLSSLRLNTGDEVLTTNHAYNACRNAIQVYATRAGAKMVVADVPFPIRSADEATQAVLACLSPRTRLVLLDHITSPTAIIFPVEELVATIQQQGVDVLVDGAHAPGHLPLALTKLGAAYYTGNCHKWMCAPKGAGFLYVRADRQPELYPTVISHGLNTRRPGRSEMQEPLDWTGTMDPTPWLCIPHAIEFISQLLPGGWRALAERNRQLALVAQSTLSKAIGLPAPAPSDMISAMATLQLPDDTEPIQLDYETAPSPMLGLQKQLYEVERFEVPVFHWPSPPRRWLRISAQAYNTLDQYERLGSVLKAWL